MGADSPKGPREDLGRGLFFVRPRRRRVVRTRLDRDAIRERLTALGAEEEPRGLKRFTAHGYFLEGVVVGPSSFVLEYCFNSVKNPQVYTVHATIEASQDWRFVHLELVARDPWASPWELLPAAAGAACAVYFGPVPPAGGLVMFGIVVAVFACANLLWVPTVSSGRVAAWIAAELSGSFRVDRRWVVPE
jgi:hypothetical protein